MSALSVWTSGRRTINYRISLLQGPIIPMSEIEGDNAQWAEKWGMKRLLHPKIKKERELLISKPSFNPRTFVLWAHNASAASLWLFILMLPRFVLLISPIVLKKLVCAAREHPLPFKFCPFGLSKRKFCQKKIVSYEETMGP